MALRIDGFVVARNHPIQIAIPLCKLLPYQPDNSAQPKIDAVRGYGASITFCPPTAPSRASALAQVQADTGATFVPPYDAVNTILGQGTAFLELHEQVPVGLAAVVAPVGGGGLLAGTALAADGTGVRVFGAEPAGADDCARGVEEGRRREDVSAQTIADGLRTPVGVLNFPIIQDKVEKVITVSDEVRVRVCARAAAVSVVVFSLCVLFVLLLRLRATGIHNAFKLLLRLWRCGY